MQLSDSTVGLAGGEFSLGSTAFYPDESPVHRVRVDPFEIDPYPVTNAQFREFVERTGYESVAERPLNPGDYPGRIRRISSQARW